MVLSLQIEKNSNTLSNQLMLEDTMNKFPFSQRQLTNKSIEPAGRNSSVQSNVLYLLVVTILVQMVLLH